MNIKKQRKLKKVDFEGQLKLAPTSASRKKFQGDGSGGLGV